MNLNFVANLDRDVILDKAGNLIHGNLGIPILLLIMLGMMTLPMPTLVLDVLFTFNITYNIEVNCCK